MRKGDRVSRLVTLKGRIKVRVFGNVERTTGKNAWLVQWDDQSKGIFNARKLRAEEPGAGLLDEANARGSSSGSGGDKSMAEDRRRAHLRRRTHSTTEYTR